MLDGQSHWTLHIFQNVALIWLSLLMLPIDTIVVAITILCTPFWQSKAIRKPRVSGKRVLVTGVGMTKGLALARLFSSAGHQVIGADFSRLACGRVSRSLKSYYTLHCPDEVGSYSQSLLRIILRENIEIWVSCSGVASATEDGEAKELVERTTSCKAVQYNSGMTKRLHEKDRFIEYTASLGLTVPETHAITSKGDLKRVLENAGNREYIAKSVGVDDVNRGNMEILSKHSLTMKHSVVLDRINISKDCPWILQQYIRGEEFCTHALVVRGRVEAFVACPSSELLMHYEALPAESSLSKAMLLFTEVFSAKSGESFTGHLSFDFLVDNPRETEPSKVRLYPIECNPRAHTAVALFSKEPELADRYMTLLPKGGQALYRPPLVPSSPARYHWNGHDLVTCLVLPLKDLVLGRGNLHQCISGGQRFLHYMLAWKDGTFEADDPLPWWWLYHVYMPFILLSKLFRQERWSRLNVSTTKVFLC